MISVGLMHRMLKIFQSTETASAQAVELKGFKRCRMKFEQGPKAVSITIDEQLSKAKYIQQSLKTVENNFDIWHVSKGKSMNEIPMAC